MNKFFIPILIFLIIIFCLLKRNNNNILNSNKNIYENFVSEYLSVKNYNDIDNIKGELFLVKYQNYISLLKSYYGDFDQLMSNYWGTSVRDKDNLYDSFIKDISPIFLINNYHKSNLFQKIFSKETHLSNFLLFVKPSHIMEIQISNLDKVINSIKENKLRIQYQIKNITPGKESSKIYMKDVAFNLYQEGKKYDTSEDLIDINKYSLDLYDGKNFLNFEDYNLSYELPTRLSGNVFSNAETSNIITSFLYLIPGKYEIDLVIESKDKINTSEIINYSNIKFIDFNPKYFTISEKTEKFIEGKTVERKLMYDLDVYIYLISNLIKLLKKNDEIDQKGFDININIKDTEGNNQELKLYIYDKDENKHSKKIRNVVTYLLFIIDSELKKYLNEKDDEDENYKKYNTMNQENIDVVNKFIDLFFEELKIQNFSDYKNSLIKILSSETEIKDQYLTQGHNSHRINLLDITNGIDENFKITPYNNETIKDNIENIISKIDNLKNKIITENYNVYTKKYLIDFKSEPLPDPNFMPEKDLSFLEIKPRKILKSIQDDLRVALNKRGTKKLDNYLSDDTISNLKRINTISKQEGDDYVVQREANIKLKKIIMNVLERIKTGDYNLITKFLNYDIKNKYQYPDPVIEEFSSRSKIREEKSMKYNNGQKTNKSKASEIKNRNKNKMNDIYNRLNMIRNTKINKKIDYDVDNDEKLSSILKRGNDTINRKNTIIEGFLPHKHTREGQIRWDIKPDLDNEQWLKKNYDTVSDYKFIPKENKQQILKSYDDMEKNIKETISFVSDTFNRFDERINIYEAEKQRKINEAQNNFNTRDYEKERIEFENKEKEQEKKTKMINNKMAELEKINNKVFNDKSFKTISSYGDGQTLSIDNIEENIYTIKANSGCLSLDKNNKLISSPCSGNDSQQFMINNIVNKEDYNKHLDIPVDDYAEVFYPFNIVKSKQNDKKCLSMKGSSLGIHDCKDTIYQRWDTKKLDKECRGDFLS